MSIIGTLTLRNIRVYGRDRLSVFFSFLSVIIVLVLYALFLGRIQVEDIRRNVGDIPGISFLINSWLMSGLLGINCITVALGALGTMVYDQEHKRFDDFLVAPVNRAAVVVSYLLSAVVITFVINLLALVAIEGFIALDGGDLLTPANLLQVVGLLALNAAVASCVLYLPVSFVRTGSVYGVVSTVLGTLIGFFTGVYVPLGALGEGVQRFVLLVPFSHGAALLRQAFCRQPLELVFHGAPQQMLDDYLRNSGVVLYWGDTPLSAGTMIAVLAGAAALFLLLSSLRLRRFKLR